MSFQVLVKTTASMTGSYSYDLGTREAAAEFVKRHDIWWWTFPVEEDTLDGSSWHRGGAWELAAMASDIPGDLSPVAPEEPGPPPLPAAQEDEDDDRW